ncbi:ChrR family anti-sigma-E factor [Methylobrevis albus]|uniref:Cupin domain-containing protein n=1 Tax=Methylobrevis albus TaxID=2793297 RepID=A0A931I556_9HYPH|nr:ChrR family anti-sigma-E factor [Methylobrevis albus]MBH0239759.1 cupin domain-containing protein [Methylobrevis albus]
MLPSRADELDALFAGYALGTLPLPLQLLVDAHLEISTRNRGFVADLEAMAGRTLESAEPAGLSDRDRRLAAIFNLGEDDAPIAPTMSEPEVESERPRMPAAIRRFLGGDSDPSRWKKVLPGFRELKLGEFDGCRTSLMWIRAGQAMPVHTHEGAEVTLVLEGGFADGIGHYEAGDIAIADDTVDHRPVADADGDCICLAITDAPLRLTGPIGRLFNPLIRG